MGPATAQGGGIRANICHSFGDPSRRRENDVDGGPRLSSVGSQTKRAVTPVSQYDFICDLGVLVCESFQKRGFWKTYPVCFRNVVSIPIEMQLVLNVNNE